MPDLELPLNDGLIAEIENGCLAVIDEMLSTAAGVTPRQWVKDRHLPRLLPHIRHVVELAANDPQWRSRFDSRKRGP